jgi:hypothetical protein
MPVEAVKRHSFVFNPNENGGEQIILMTQFFPASPTSKDVFAVCELSLQSQGNSATFTLGGDIFSPENLRELANQLDVARNEAKAKLSK